jgi:hypothetical protein
MLAELPRCPRGSGGEKIARRTYDRYVWHGWL